MKVDIAVIGLGAVGTAALWQLSKRGVNVLGIDRFSPPHEMGSSHGETRITRLAVGEGSQYIPFVKRSHEIWKELENLSGETIHKITGGILIDSGNEKWSKHGSEGFLERTVNFAKSHGIAHEILDGREVNKRFSGINIEPNGRVYYEPSAGVVFPEKAISVQLGLAQANGARLMTNTPVFDIKEGKDGDVQIATPKGIILAGKVLLTVGAWIKDFLPNGLQSNFKICRQVLHWLPIDHGSYSPNQFPVFMWGFGPQPEDFIYGFPSFDGQSIKVASESFIESPHPDLINRQIDPEEQDNFLNQKIKNRLPLTRNEVLRSKVCIYTVRPDANFVVSLHPELKNTVLVSACSGHGFKHSAALGESLADQLIDNQPVLQTNNFPMI